MNINQLRLGVIFGLVLAALMSRLVPHYPNFTAVAAVGIFGGYHAQKLRHSFGVVFAAMILSDLILGFHDLMPVVYGAMLVPVLIGKWLRGSSGILAVAGGGVVSSLTFFAITNFAFWLQSGMYPMTGAGLAGCFLAAVPFLKHQLMGDFFYGSVLFGTYHLVQSKLPILKASST